MLVAVTSGQSLRHDYSFVFNYFVLFAKKNHLDVERTGSLTPVMNLRRYNYI